ncbi:unnamed protein product [Ectocarpus sp. 13 AM-2016]
MNAWTPPTSTDVRLLLPEFYVDFDDLASCLEAAGPQTITTL